MRLGAIIPTRWRTTTARIAIIVFLAMMVTSIVLIGFIERVTDNQLRTEITASLDRLSRDVANDLRTRGVAATALEINADMHLPGPYVILLEAPDGIRLAGNLANWPTVTAEAGRRPETVMLDRLGDSNPGEFSIKLYQLDGGYQLLVGRSLETEQRLTDTLRTSLLGAAGLALALAALTAIMVSREIARRVQAIADVATAVATGDLSQRVDVAAAQEPGDAFDAMTRAINAMLARTEMLIDEIRMVTDGLAHDLRSPLTRMKVRIDRLARAGFGHEEELAAITAEADALLVMLENCLEISRVEAGIGRDAFALFDVAALTRDLAEMYAPLAEESDIELSVSASTPLPVMAHRNLISRALANLIDNALRYGSGGGRIAIEAQDSPSGVTINIADKGPGIAVGNHREALRRFGRIDAARAAGGVGLGLPLAAAIARLHGGTLALTDNAPGLRVTITLPDATSPSPGTQA
jgi:signal transduction histidine kinase